MSNCIAVVRLPAQWLIISNTFSIFYEEKEGFYCKTHYIITPSAKRCENYGNLSIEQILPLRWQSHYCNKRKIELEERIKKFPELNWK
jgi:hypothetical protein